MPDDAVSAYLSTKIYENLNINDTFGSSGRFVVVDRISDTNSGYYGAIIKDTFTGEGILVNRGTEFWNPTDFSDIAADMNIVFGGAGGTQFTAAKDFLNNYKQQQDAISITSTVGHSLGGYLAQVLGIAENLNVTAIGSPGVTSALNNLAADGYNVSGYDPSKTTIIYDSRDSIATYGTHLAGANIQTIDSDSQVRQTFLGRVSSTLLKISDLTGLDAFDVLTIYGPIGTGTVSLGSFTAGLQYHPSATYHEVITNNYNENFGSIGQLAITSNNDGNIVTVLDRITFVDSSDGSNTIFYLHTDGNFFSFKDNPDGSKVIFYKDQNGNDVIKSFNSFTDVSGLTAYEVEVALEFGYQKFAEEKIWAKKFYEDNPDIYNSPEYEALPQSVKDKVIALYNEGLDIFEETSEKEGVISGGFNNDTVIGSAGGDGLGIGAENFSVGQLVYIIQTGTKEHQIGAALDLYQRIITEGVYDAANDAYQLGDATIETVTNSFGGDAVKISYVGIAQSYITQYSAGNFQQRVVETVGLDGRTNSALITIADGLVNELYHGKPVAIAYPDDFVFGAIGGIVGDSVGQLLENGELAHDIIVNGISRTALSNFGEVLDFLAEGQNNLSESLFDPIAGVNGTNQVRPSILDDFLVNLQTGVLAAVSGKIVEELGDAINIDGVGGEIFNVAAGTVTNGILNESFGLIFNNMPAGVYTKLLSSGFDWNAAIHDPNKLTYLDASGNPLPNSTVGDFVQAQVFNALGAYAGQRLAGELIEPESEAAAIFGAAGSALGTAIGSGTLLVSTAVGRVFEVIGATFGGPVGIAIGAFVGTIVGTVLGNAIAGYDDPAGGAILKYDYQTGEYYLHYIGTDDGGDIELVQSMADYVTNGVNNVLEMTQGQLRSTSNVKDIRVEYEGEEFRVLYDGETTTYDSIEGAIGHAAFSLLKDYDLVGGHAVIMRAWHNSDATNIDEFKDDIMVAEAFQNYLIDPTAILALMINEPESDLAQYWSVILERAHELELHLPHELDLDGGWGEVLLAQGIDPDVLPEYDSNIISITDPITGEVKELNHLIGPGYEIVRFEGTDGNDTIEILVDGPSVNYLSGGAGDDTLIGSDQNDIILGEDGDDFILGLDGYDWINGGAGQDIIDGGAGDDLIIGGAGNDLLSGGAQDDFVYGNEGDDVLRGYTGLDTLYGGAGADVLHAESDDRAHGGSGNDTLYAYGFNASLYGGDGNDTFIIKTNTGTISHTFAGVTGIYDVYVTYYDETDGESEFGFSIDGLEIDSWIADDDLGRTTAHSETLVTRVIQDVSIIEGNVLSMMSHKDASELGRIDKIALIPSTPDEPEYAFFEAEDWIMSGAYQIENVSAASDGKVAGIYSTTQSGTITQTFNGVDGVYDITITYFDETDGQSPFAFNVNATEVDNWVADSTAGAAGATAQSLTSRTLENVTLTNGDMLSLRASRHSGEIARVDTIELTPVATDPYLINVEAENLILAGAYQLENVASASNGKVVSISNYNQVGTITYDFEGFDGNYDIEITYYDETDGESPFAVLQNDTEIDSWVADSILGDVNAISQSLTTRLISNINLENGDYITIESERDNYELGRVDKISFIPVDATVPYAIDYEAEDWDLGGAYTVENIASSSSGEAVSIESEGHSNIVVISRGDGHDIINAVATANKNYIKFDKSIEAGELWFSQSGLDLQIDVLGENQSITVQNWFDVVESRPNFDIWLNGGLMKLDRGQVDSLISVFSNGPQPQGDFNVLNNSDYPIQVYDIYHGSFVNNHNYAEKVFIYGETYLVTDISNEDNIIQGTNSRDNKLGGAGRDTIYGYNRGDFIHGGVDNDFISGGNGDDVLLGGLGSDHIKGNIDNDIIFGGIGNDILYGGSGDDIIDGGYSDDYIFGERGQDTLTGGQGKDIFVFYGEWLDAVDIVSDFDELEDTIKFTDVFENFSPIDSAINDFITFTEQGDHTMISVDIDGAGTEHESESIILLENKMALNVSDLYDNGAIIIAETN